MYNSYIKDEEILDLLKLVTSNNNKIIFVFDSCHSGDILDLKYKLIDNKFKKLNENINEYKKSNIIAICSCKFNQKSVDGINGGAFTNRFIEILKKYNYKISFINLYNELNDRLRFLFRYFNLEQNPEISSSKKHNINNIIF